MQRILTKPGSLLVVDNVLSHADEVQAFIALVEADKNFSSMVLDIGAGLLLASSSNISTPEFRAIQAEMAPKLSEYQSKITQNAALFARIKALHDDAANLKLTPHQARLLKLVYDRFQLNGAELTGEKRERYAAINAELAELQTKFSNNLLADEEGWVTYLTPSQLGGLPASFVASAKAAAEARERAAGLAGQLEATQGQNAALLAAIKTGQGSDAPAPKGGKK